MKNKNPCSEVFHPTISYRVASLHMGTTKPRTPWQYLQDWHMSDRHPSTTLEDVAISMKNQWPGNYRVVEKEDYPYRGNRVTKWVIEFDDPAEETMFNLKWR